VPLPTWSVGQILAAADVNTYFIPRTAYKTSAEHRSNTTLAADAQLTVPVDASSHLRGLLLPDLQTGRPRPGT